MQKVSRAELEFLLKEQSTRKKNIFDITDFCFDKQLKFINDKARFKTAVCSRRSGKSVTCAADLVNQCVNKKNANCLYITLTRGNAKKLVWKEVLEINKRYNLGGVPNTAELYIKFETQNSILYFSGASKREEIEKYRGLSLNLVYIDEVQSFKPYVKELIDEVLAYAVLDTGGSICLIGTPGPVPAGYFYDTTHSKGWSNHKWTVFDNPFIKLKTGRTPEKLLAEERERRGITEQDPAYLREALGLWVQDSDSLVYKYNPNINGYDELPDKDELVYVFGVDLGYNDADAIAVLGWHKKKKLVYLVEEMLKEKQGITELAVQIQNLIDKYKPVKIKIDAGALGKKIGSELTRRHQIPVEAAEKSRKLEFIELLNDDLRTGKLKIKRDSTCANDYMLIQWDVIIKEKRTISDNFHSDIADAVLYAWRECLHFTSSEKVVEKVTDEGTVEEFWEKQAQLLEKKKNGEWWD